MRGERGEGDCKGMNMWNKSSRGFKPGAKVVGRNEMEIKTNVCIRLVFLANVSPYGRAIFLLQVICGD